MKDGFLKAAALSPALRVADCDVQHPADHRPAARGRRTGASSWRCFPELCLTGYTCGDLFLQQHPAAGRAEAAAAERSGRQRRAGRGRCWWACRCWYGGKLYNCAAVVCTADSCSGWCRRPTCPTTANFTKSATSRPRRPRCSRSRRLRAGTSPSARTCSSAAGSCPTSCWAWKSARTCGRPRRRRTRHAPPGRPSSPTSRPATRRSARPSTAAQLVCQPVGPAALRLPLRRRGRRANPPPTWSLPAIT